jgi:hypothetical protein
MAAILSDRIRARLEVVEEHVRRENAHDLPGIMTTFGHQAWYDDEPIHGTGLPPPTRSGLVQRIGFILNASDSNCRRPISLSFAFQVKTYPYIQFNPLTKADNSALCMFFIVKQWKGL